MTTLMGDKAMPNIWKLYPRKREKVRSAEGWNLMGKKVHEVHGE
jgi:hypothetical protein